VKVKDLIEVLYQLDQDKNIKVSDGGTNCPTFYDNVDVISNWDKENYYLVGDF
jgi:hypothetical protein